MKAQKPNPLVKMNECVSAIEIYFRRCYAEREEVNAEEAYKTFADEYDTLVELFLTPEDSRSPYQIALMEEIEANERAGGGGSE